MKRIYQYDKKAKKVVQVNKRKLVQGIPHYPIMPEALGVQPEEIGKVMDYDRRHGVQTEYTSDGRPIMRDRSHYNKYLRAHGFYHRNAGYGDVAPENR